MLIYFADPIRRNVRSKNRSLNLRQLFEEKGRNPLPIKFDKARGTWRPVDDYQKYFPRLIGVLVRQNVDPWYKNWKSVPAEQKGKIIHAVEVKRYMAFIKCYEFCVQL